jgi:phospholipase/carboxylesterase
VTDFEPERWGADPKLVEVLGDQGAAQFRALFDGFPEAVGVLWAIRDDGGRIVDFSFGYGNPSILRAFRLPAATRDRYTLLEALPRMRGSRAFDAYVRVCDTGEPWVHEVTYDTPFGDGYMLGTWVQRSAKLGDGLVNFLTDVTAQRRMEADLRRYADVVAHDLSEPIAGIEMLVRMLERRAEEPSAPARPAPVRTARAARSVTAEAILDLARLLNRPGFAYLAPQAAGNTWYPYSFMAPVENNEPWLSDALKLLESVEKDVYEKGLNSRQFYILGFSQGACLASEFAARNAKRYGGVIAFTGGLIGETIDRSNYRGDFAGTPVFVGNSDRDPHIPVSRSEETQEVLDSMGARVTLKIYPNMPHTIIEDELNFVNNHILQHS